MNPITVGEKEDSKMELSGFRFDGQLGFEESLFWKQHDLEFQSCVIGGW